jgi:hypothetical protein
MSSAAAATTISPSSSPPSIRSRKESARTTELSVKGEEGVRAIAPDRDEALSSAGNHMTSSGKQSRNDLARNTKKNHDSPSAVHTSTTAIAPSPSTGTATVNTQPLNTSTTESSAMTTTTINNSANDAITSPIITTSSGKKAASVPSIDTKATENSSPTSMHGNTNTNVTTMRTSPSMAPPETSGAILTLHDLRLCQRLDQQYVQALEEQDVSYSARYQSVRQSACFSVTFMLLFLTLGTLFFQKQAGWDVHNALLYSIVAITTVGYGHLETPETPTFQWYTLTFILVGMATLTIMVAQVYQCIALEASRAQHLRDSHPPASVPNSSTNHNQSTSTWARLGGWAPDGLWRTSSRWDIARPHSPHSTSSSGAMESHSNSAIHRLPTSSPTASPEGLTVEILSTTPTGMAHVRTLLLECIWRSWDRLRVWCQLYPSLTVILPMLVLIWLGALIMMVLEDWSLTEALYFSVVSLTTVGFGDYYPTHPASIWFCILWLPCSVGFVSLYLGYVAAWYLRLSEHNIHRIEQRLRQHVRRSKEQAARDRQAVRERALRGQSTPPRPTNRKQRQEQPHDGTSVTIGNDHDYNRFDDEDDHDNNNDGTDDNSENLSNHPSRTGRGVPAVVHRFRGFDSLPLADRQGRSIGSSVRNGSVASEDDSVSMRRERILANSRQGSLLYENDDDHRLNSTDQSTPTQSRHGLESPRMKTMRNVLDTIKINMPNTKDFSAGPESTYLSLRSSQPLEQSGLLRRWTARKPSLALRALVQERFAEIIATEVAGFHSRWVIQDCTLSLTIHKLHAVADKWLIPRRSRKAFRATALEVLYFVGERGLVTRGADALFDLTPLEFNELFSPLLASLGDAETMEVWLNRTRILAEVDLYHSRDDAEHHYNDTASYTLGHVNDNDGDVHGREEHDLALKESASSEAVSPMS